MGTVKHVKELQLSFRGKMEMTIKLERQDITDYSILLISIISIFFPVAGALIGVPVPGYLSAYILCVLLLLFQATFYKRYYVSFSKERFFLFFLFVYLLGSNTYTQSVVAASEKTLNIVYAIVIPWLLISVIMSLTPKVSFNIVSFEDKLVKISYILLFISTFLFIVGATEDFEAGRTSLIGMVNPIWSGRIFGCMLMVLTYDIFYRKHHSSLNYFCVLLGFYLLLRSGSRGPLAAYLITSSVFILRALSFRRILLFSCCFLLLLVLAAVFVGGRMFDLSIFSLVHRVNFAGFIFENDVFNPWKGNGIGMFGLMYMNEDVISYPHNIFLELFFEFGMIGVGLFALNLYYFFRGFFINCIHLSTLFFFINSLFSGDLSGNNFLFIFMYLATYLAVHKKSFSQSKITIV